MGLEKNKMHGNKFHLLELSSNIAKLGNEVFVVYPEYRNTESVDLKELGMNAIPIKVGNKNVFNYILYHLKLCFKINGLINKLKPDIFYERDLVLSKSIFKNVKKHRIPIVSEINGVPRNNDDKDKLGNFYRNLILKDMKDKAKYADKIRVVVNQQKEILINLCDRSITDKVEVITIGTNTELYKPEDINFSRKYVNEYLDDKGIDFHIEEDEFLIVFLGTLNYGIRSKGVVDLITVLKEIKNKKIKFLILGPGEKIKDIKDEYSKLGMECNIRAVGPVEYEKSNHFINSADLCFLPQITMDKKQEGLSLKLSSYMACGKRILASKVPGIDEKVGKFDGYVWDIDDTEDLHEKIKEAYSNRYLWDKSSEEREYIINFHSWKVISKKLNSLFDELKDSENK